MNSVLEPLLIIVIVLLIAGPAGFVRYRLYNRYLRSQESIAESLQKIAEHLGKTR